MVIQWSFTPLSLRDISPEGEKILILWWSLTYPMTTSGQMTINDARSAYDNRMTAAGQMTIE
jgi:hypothetical protein